MRLFMYHHRRDEREQSLARLRRAAARTLPTAIGLLAAQAAYAQLSTSVALTSEYSERGVSLSKGRPAAQLSLAWDAPQGWFAGAMAAPRLTLDERRGVTQLVAYGGFAQRLASGLSWEAGVSSNSFLRAHEYDYREVFAGLASDHLNARLYVAPAYYGEGGRTAYVELNGFHPLRERIKLAGHIGWLHGLRGPIAELRDRIDLRLAIELDVGACNVNLAWLARTAVGSGAANDRAPSPRAVALSATYSF
jgi:uncharacterized protein (TIGR02001 family)